MFSSKISEITLKSQGLKLPIDQPSTVSPSTNTSFRRLSKSFNNLNSNEERSFKLIRFRKITI
jgi:hypothetical protein